MSQPGHEQRLRLIGDVLVLKRDLLGRLAGVVVKVHVREPMTISVLAPAWPAGIAEGTRLEIVGQLGQERLPHKKGTHFVHAEYVSVVPRRRCGLP